MIDYFWRWFFIFITYPSHIWQWDETSTHLWVLIRKSDICKRHCTCLPSYVYRLTELLRLGYHHSFPILLCTSWEIRHDIFQSLNDWSLLLIFIFTTWSKGEKIKISWDYFGGFILLSTLNIQAEPHMIFLYLKNNCPLVTDNPSATPIRPSQPALFLWVCDTTSPTCPAACTAALEPARWTPRTCMFCKEEEDMLLSYVFLQSRWEENLRNRYLVVFPTN